MVYSNFLLNLLLMTIIRSRYLKLNYLESSHFSFDLYYYKMKKKIKEYLGSYHKLFICE
jgi:hypothetical protein